MSEVIQREQLQNIARERGYVLCHECVSRYEPCESVALGARSETRVAHIWISVCVCDGEKVWMGFEDYCLCGWSKERGVRLDGLWYRAHISSAKFTLLEIKPTEFISLSSVRHRVRRHDGKLCGECAKHYEPSISVALNWGDDTNTAHILQGIGKITNTGKALLEYPSRLCHPEERHRGVPWLVLKTRYVDGSFLCHLMRSYPQLVANPLTERFLRKVVGSIEAEWALWKLGSDEI
jgi:hypothetical protein